MHWHTKQFGLLIVSLFLLIILIGVILCICVGDLGYVIPIFIIVPIIAILLFYQLEVIVDDKTLLVKLGIGIIQKRFFLHNIISAKSIENSALAGWGIRILPEFTLYNVSGFKSVEIELKNRSRKFRIGFEDPDEFIKFLDNKNPQS